MESAGFTGDGGAPVRGFREQRGELVDAASTIRTCAGGRGTDHTEAVGTGLQRFRGRTGRRVGTVQLAINL